MALSHRPSRFPTDCPQFVGGGPVVHVRNTFIDVVIEDPISGGCKKLRRFNTFPVSGERDEMPTEPCSERGQEAPVLPAPHCHSAPVSVQGTSDDFRALHTSCLQQSCESTPSSAQEPTNDFATLHASSLEQAPMMLPSVCPNRQPLPSPVVRWTPVLIPVTGAVVDQTCGNARLESRAAEVWIAAVAAAEAKPAQGLEAHGKMSSQLADEQAMEAIVGAKTSEKAAAQLRRLRQPLLREISESGLQRITWCVDARGLRGNVKQVVSPSFQVPLDSNNPSTPFRMTLHPKRLSRCRGGATFELARGRGCVQLKCEGGFSSEVGFHISIGSDNEKKYTRGPVRHDFSQRVVAGLPKGNDEWDFFKAIDPQSDTFIIIIEIALLTDMRSDSVIGGS